MSGRSMRARLDRIAAQLGVDDQRPECRFHGLACGLGNTWPLPYPEDAEASLAKYLRELRREAGEEVGPSPRDLWEMGIHDLVTEAEKRQREAELQELLAALRADNEAGLAQLLAERDAE